MKQALSTLLLNLLISSFSPAHGANPVQPGASPTIIERPQRLADGALFVSKPLQRQLGITTTRVNNAPAPQTVTLAGHLIASNHSLGLVQASQPGLLQAPADGLPSIGQQVKRGQILAWLLPQPNAADGASIDAGLAEANGKRRQAEQDLARMTALRPHVSQQQLDLLQIEIDTEQARIKAFQQARAKQALRAPLDGIISNSKVAAGQIVDLRDTLFEIVDPKQLWVEVTAFDPSLPKQMIAAHASTADGRNIDLQYIGSSNVLRDQARPMIFRLQGNNANLAIGTRVDVQIHTRSNVPGAVLPANAISRDTAGNRVVWLHQQAERFVAQRVAPIATHEGKMLVPGLPQGARIVINGAGLLAQIR